MSQLLCKTMDLLDRINIKCFIRPIATTFSTVSVIIEKKWLNWHGEKRTAAE